MAIESFAWFVVGVAFIVALALYMNHHREEDSPQGELLQGLGYDSREAAALTAETQRRIARVALLAERVLGDPAKARAWLKAKNRSLGGSTPLSLLEVKTGEELVEGALKRIEFGVYG